MALQILLTLPPPLLLPFRESLKGLLHELISSNSLRQLETHDVVFSAILHLLVPSIANEDSAMIVLSAITPESKDIFSPAEVLRLLHIFTLYPSDILYPMTFAIDQVISTYYPPSSSLPPEWKELRTMYTFNFEFGG